MAVLDDFTIDYANKRIEHTAGTTVYTVNTLYSALQDTFDELGQMDDDVPMSAQTPTEYTLINGWFMGDTDMQFLKGGAIQTSGWTGGVIIKRPWATGGAGGDPDTADIGGTVTGDTSTHTGTIMDVSATEIWIRLDNTSNQFNNSEGFTISGTSTHTGSFGAAAAATGENLWANPFSLGTIATNTELYVIQNGAPVSVYWPEGHMDILIKVRDMGTEIDNAIIEVFAHKPGTLYDHFQIDLTSGGRQPVPLATSSDLNEASGHYSLGISSASGSYTVGELITGGTSSARAIVTAETGDPTTTVEYFLIGDGVTDFTGTEVITGATSSVTGNKSGASTGINAATYSDVTVSFAFVDNYDIGDSDGPGDYAVTVNCGSRTNLLQVYERIKYLQRHGETSNLLNGIQGEEFIGFSNAIGYTESVAFTTIGQVVTGGTSGATGVVGAIDSTGKVLYLHNVKGSFTATESITGASEGSGTNITVSSLTLNKVSGLATYAGGRLFGSPGVRFTNIPSGYNNSYQMTDLAGNVQEEPIQVTIQISSLNPESVAGDGTGDAVFVARRNADNTVLRAQYTDLAAASVGASSLVLNTGTSDADTPTAGTIRVARADGTDERYRYSGHTAGTATFTLTTVDAGTGVTTGGTTTFTDTSANFTNGTNDPKPGDRIRNITDGSIATIVSIDGATSMTTTALTGGTSDDWAVSDTYEINKVNVTVSLGDDAYVPFIDKIAEAATEANTVIYSVNRDTTIRVRKKGIQPFTQNTTQLGSGGLSASAIRTTDSIVTL
jgi:hypothetical protein